MTFIPLFGTVPLLARYRKSENHSLVNSAIEFVRQILVKRLETPVLLHRRRLFLLRQAHDAEIVARFGVIRSDLNGLPESFQSFLPLAELGVYDTQAVDRFGVSRIYANRLLERRDRLSRAPRLMKRYRKVEIGFSPIRLKMNRLLMGGDRFLIFAGLQIYDAEVVMRPGIIGPQADRFLELHVRLFGAPEFVILCSQVV